MEVAFICLANSRKYGGRCVAGIRTDGGGWIRPVARRRFGTLSQAEYTLGDKREAGLLDVIRIQVAVACPEPGQPENLILGRRGWRLIDWLLGTPQWRLAERIEPLQAVPMLEEYLSPGPSLLGNESDRVPYPDLVNSPARASLTLIEPSDVSWSVQESYAGKRQTRARFRLRGRRYDLSVTDPVWERRLSHLPGGTQRREAAGITPDDRLFFTVSLGEPYFGNNPAGECFKLVAAVIVLPR